MPHILWSIELIRSRLFGGQKSGSSWGEYECLDYFTFRVEATNDAQTVWLNTTCGKDHS